MTESHPDSFQVEIDRKKLCQYLRLQAICSLLAIFVSFGSLLGFASYAEKAEKMEFESTPKFVGYCLQGVGFGVSASLVISLSVYLVFFHFPSKRQANAVELSVEGQYLRFREGFLFKQDRKLHFRSIVDYSCYEGPLMRWCGIAGISMTTLSGGQNSILKVPAVKDAEKVRDLLSVIDRQREDMIPKNQQPE